jgi:hypothetical protein
MHGPLPQMFCWTRFGTEAGEGIESILARKEAERVANGGVFLWGIGNSIAPGLSELVAEDESPELLFSPILSRPRPFDIAPPHLVVWRAGEALDGERYALPESACVTSGAREASPSRHYALVCRSDTPLCLGEFGQLNFASLSNLVSGRRLGVSQVTAVVSHDPQRVGGPDYQIALRANLVPPYFVRLDEGTLVESKAALIA